MTSIQFKFPSTIFLAGSSQTGKSSFFRDLVINSAEIFTIPPKSVTWICRFKSPELQELHKRGLVHRIITEPQTFEEISVLCGHSKQDEDHTEVNGRRKENHSTNCEANLLVVDDFVHEMKVSLSHFLSHTSTLKL